MVHQFEMFENKSISSAQEERRTTGRMVAIVAALFLLCIAIYHAWIRKTAILAGVIVPALIIILYAAYIVFLAKREKRRFLVRENGFDLLEVLSMSKSMIPAQETETTIKTDFLNKHNKPKRKCRRKQKQMKAVKLKMEFLQTKQYLLAQSPVILPQFIPSTKLWTRSLTIA